MSTLTSLQIVDMPATANSTWQPASAKPAQQNASIQAQYAVTDILPAKDEKNVNGVCMYVHIHMSSV